MSHLCVTITAVIPSVNAPMSAPSKTLLPTIMATTENEHERTHNAITCMCSSTSCDVR